MTPLPINSSCVITVLIGSVMELHMCSGSIGTNAKVALTIEEYGSYVVNRTVSAPVAVTDSISSTYGWKKAGSNSFMYS